MNQPQSGEETSSPQPPSPTSSDPQDAPPTSSPQQRGFVEDIVLNAFEPGVNHSVLLCLNASFLLLIITLLSLTLLVGFNIHIIFLTVLAAGLMVAFNWFISQLSNDGTEQQTEISSASSSESIRPKKD